MPYVSREPGGNVNGVFRWPVEGAAEEFLSDADPEIITFRTPKPQIDRLEGKIQSNDVLRRIVAVLADEVGKTERQILDAIKAKP